MKTSILRSVIVGSLLVFILTLFVVSLFQPWYTEIIDGNATGIASCRWQKDRYWEMDTLECFDCTLCSPGTTWWQTDCEKEHCVHQASVYNATRVCVGISVCLLCIAFITFCGNACFSVPSWVSTAFSGTTLLLSLCIIIAFAVAHPISIRSDREDTGDTSCSIGPCSSFIGDSNFTSLFKLLQGNWRWGATVGYWLYLTGTILLFVTLMVMLSTRYWKRASYPKI